MLPSVPLRERRRKHRARAYVLVRAVQDRAGDAVSALRQNNRVVAADRIEGCHDIIVVIEAANRLELAKAAMNVFLSVEAMIDGVDLLPVRDETEGQGIRR